MTATKESEDVLESPVTIAKTNVATSEVEKAEEIDELEKQGVADLLEAAKKASKKAATPVNPKLSPMQVRVLEQMITDHFYRGVGLTDQKLLMLWVKEHDLMVDMLHGRAELELPTRSEGQPLADGESKDEARVTMDFIVHIDNYREAKLAIVDELKLTWHPHGMIDDPTHPEWRRFSVRNCTQSTAIKIQERYPKWISEVSKRR